MAIVCTKADSRSNNVADFFDRKSAVGQFHGSHLNCVWQFCAAISTLCAIESWSPVWRRWMNYKFMVWLRLVCQDFFFSQKHSTIHSALTKFWLMRWLAVITFNPRFRHIINGTQNERYKKIFHRGHIFTKNYFTFFQSNGRFRNEHANWSLVTAMLFYPGSRSTQLVISLLEDTHFFICRWSLAFFFLTPSSVIHTQIEHKYTHTAHTHIPISFIHITHRWDYCSMIRTHVNIRTR